MSKRGAILVDLDGKASQRSTLIVVSTQTTMALCCGNGINYGINLLTKSNLEITSNRFCLPRILKYLRHAKGA